MFRSAQLLSFIIKTAKPICYIVGDGKRYLHGVRGGMAGIRLQPPEPFDFKQPDEWTRRFEQNRVASGLTDKGEARQVCTPDLPTHPIFSGYIRILQGSPAHPRRIASHLHLARYTSAALSVNLFR